MPRRQQPADPPGARDRLARALKWVGAVTSILSLIFGLYQLMNLTAGVRERQRRVAELLHVETAQRTAGDFARAWATLQEAAKLADEGGKFATIMGRLDDVRQEVRHRQEDLAMAWLRDAQPGPGRAFSDIVNPVLPVLERGLLTATGEHKADLLAHLGWADFLRFRDDGVMRNPDARYREAWRSGPLDAATREFSAALASGRAREYVRRIQIAALLNRGRDDADAELLRVVTDMRKKEETVDERTRARVFSIYASVVARDEPSRQRLLAALSPSDQLATFQALFDGQDFDPAKRPSRDLCLAWLQEAAGRPDDALRTLRAARAELIGDPSGNLARAIDASIARLSQRPFRSSNAK